MLRERVLSLWWHTLCRRSQKRLPWTRMLKLGTRCFRNRACSILTRQFASPLCICDKEPDALTSARPGPCGGCWATGIPTAIKFALSFRVSGEQKAQSCDKA